MVGPRPLLVALLLAAAPAVAGCLVPADAADAPVTREFTLEAVEADVELWPGKVVRMWTYNGQVPGPLLRATEGDRVVVHFWNNHSLPHTIHFHGDHPYEMDGDDAQAVAPGGYFRYEFVAAPAGAFVYHCHVDTPVHIPMGLYGQFIVDPKGGWGGEAPDKEFFLVYSGWNPNGNATAETHMLNGKAYPLTKPLQVEVGERVRMFISSLDEEAIAVHFHGTLPRQIWPGEHPIDVIPLAHAESRVVDYVATHAGPWMFHDHYEKHLRNDGVYPGGTLNAVEVGRQWWGKGHGGHGADPAHAGHGADADAPTEEDLAGARQVEIGDNAFQPQEIRIKVGETVAWTNRGASVHTVTSDEEGGPLASGYLKPGQSYAHTFDAPGEYAYHCAPHSARGEDGRYVGMVGKVVVEAA